MQDVNVRFKDFPPEETVKRIKNILEQLGIDTQEKWNDSGIENCWSLGLYSEKLYPLSSNGKGVSRELARASAYGEFIERIQCGLMLYKYQSITRDSAFDLQSYAPDGKYMTVQELIDNGEWMDFIIKTYQGGLTREKLAEHCRIYGYGDDGKVWTLPFYSLFEDKTVYLPAGFVEHIYSANGCCAGNTREEAWVHALSEIMERRSTVSMITGKKTAPQIPDEVIKQYPLAYNILEAIRQSEYFDIQLLDFSQGIGYPVVATRLIDKHSHSYIINTAADPVFEIALDRTLTESFQGRTLHNIKSRHVGLILEEAANIPVAHNVLNQLETGNGLFCLDFFTEESVQSPSYPEFADSHNKNNKELLNDVLAFYKKLGHPIYVRNYSFLGFPSYHLVVPGISENRGMKLLEPISEFALGDAVYSAFRSVETASDDSLLMLLSFYKKVQTAISRVNNFPMLAGLPMNYKSALLLTNVTLAHAAYKLKQYSVAIAYLKKLDKAQNLQENEKEYFSCVSRYMSLMNARISAEQTKVVLYKFYREEIVNLLYDHLDHGRSPLHDYLLRCDSIHCENCQYQQQCSYGACRELFATIGEKYEKFEKQLCFDDSLSKNDFCFQ